MSEHPLEREGFAHRQPQGNRLPGMDVTGPVPAPKSIAAQHCWGAVARRPERVVELPDTGEAGSEGGVAEGHGGGLDQNPGGLHPLSPGKCQRTCSDLAL